MNKHLYRRLLQRGAIKAIKELEARDRIVERNDVCYSTQQAEPAAKAVERNRGCIPSSDGIRTRNAFEPSTMRSGNTGFVTREGRIYRTSQFHMRMMKAGGR